MPSLPAGKLPADLLRSLLATNAIHDPCVVVGAGARMPRCGGTLALFTSFAMLRERREEIRALSPLIPHQARDVLVVVFVMGHQFQAMLQRGRRNQQVEGASANALSLPLEGRAKMRTADRDRW